VFPVVVAKGVEDGNGVVLPQNQATSGTC
jgi:hypothetical protein